MDGATPFSMYRKDLNTTLVSYSGLGIRWSNIKFITHATLLVSRLDKFS